VIKAAAEKENTGQSHSESYAGRRISEGKISYSRGLRWQPKPVEPAQGVGGGGVKMVCGAMKGSRGKGIRFLGDAAHDTAKFMSGVLAAEEIQGGQRK